MKSEESEVGQFVPQNLTKDKPRVRLTAREAASIQWRLVHDWKPRSDVWPFRYGVWSIGAASAFAGAYYNSYYRKVTKLAQYGRVASYLPVVIIPSVFSFLTHLKWVSSDVLIQKTRCSVCVELRAVALQVAFGVVYPLIMAPVGSFFIASQFYTYAVPDFIPIRKYLAHWWTITKPLTNRIHATIVLQAVVAATVTYLEYNSLEKVNKKLDEEAIRNNNDKFT